jgi:DNA-binding transcriptional LysR family regulator
MSVDLRLMRYVVAVAEAGGFQHAADRLHVPQPALSRQVRQLEREIGVELFHRRPTRVTEPGRAFVDEARRILADVDRALEHTRLVARGEVGTVRVGYTMSAAFDALPRLLDNLYRGHPRLEIETGRRWDAELVADLHDGRFDVVVGHNLAYVPGLASAVLRREHLAAVLPIDHTLARRAAVALHELRGETLRFVARRLAPHYFDFVVAALRSTGESFDVHESADPRLGTFGVDDFGGFTVVPSSAGGRLPRGVVCVPLTDPLPTVQLDMAWRPDAISSPAKLVIETARELAWVD